MCVLERINDDRTLFRLLKLTSEACYTTSLQLWQNVIILSTSSCCRNYGKTHGNVYFCHGKKLKFFSADNIVENWKDKIFSAEKGVLNNSIRSLHHLCAKIQAHKLISESNQSMAYTLLVMNLVHLIMLLTR